MGSSSNKKEKKKLILKEINEMDIEKMKETEKNILEKEINEMNNIEKKKESEKNIDYEKEILEDKKVAIAINDQNKITLQSIFSLCKIFNNDNGCGSGFFCNLKFSENGPSIKTLITNNHVLGIEDIALNKKIKLTINNYASSRVIDIGGERKLYTNKIFDITIIEIKDADELNFVKYLDIDDKVFNKDIQKKYDKIYIIHYPGNSAFSFISYGDMTIGEENGPIKHTCITEHGSSGSPILDLSTFKILGIHKGKNKSGKKEGLGTFLKWPIEEFEAFNNEGILDNYGRLKEIVNRINNDDEEKEDKKNIINIILKANKTDINQKIYFLGNSEDIKKNNMEKKK